MKTTFSAIKAQEKIVYAELIKYLGLVANIQEEFVGEYEDLERKRPAFFISSIIRGVSMPLIFSSHMISPATLRQEDYEPLDMQTVVTYGTPSIAAALLKTRLDREVQDITTVTLELEQMSHGVGLA